MKNKLNIDDQVKINKPGVIGDGAIATVIVIQKFGDKIFYTGTYHQECSNGGEGYETSIQFEEGQYEKIKKK